ncbi:MAG: 3'-5' exonuclease [Pseudomonadota bacterium]|nr:3'-5' exonuclease [Pseudomonadota bacterium]
MNVFVFDIETVPDVENARRLWGLEELDDDGVAAVMYSKRQQETGGATDFIRHHLHRIVAIAAAFREDDRLKLWSLGEEDSSEEELVRRFFEGVERYSPTLVSWNGSGFDLPVLHYRAMLHGIAAPRYWDTGEEDRSFRYNNYLGRFHWRHIDLMDVLAGYQARAFAPLDQMASILGFPGKMGMTGADVWDYYRAGKIKAIRAYCETDVLNTYLVFLKFQHMRGHLQDTQLRRELEQVQDFLASSEHPHLQEFLSAWNAASSL